jgi:dCMP deaminase
MRYKWIKRFIGLADYVAQWSDDRSTKCGCVFVDPLNHNVISMGFNGFPRGIADEEERHERPAKYTWTEHAERNGIYNAAERGASLGGSHAFITHLPCTDCARGLIQSGVDFVYFNEANVMGSPNWEEDFRTSQDMLMEAGIEIVGVDLSSELDA